MPGLRDITICPPPQPSPCLPRLPLTHSEWLDETVARHRATLLEMPSSDVPREEVERRLETLENLYQTRQHLHATAGRFSPPPRTERSR